MQATKLPLTTLFLAFYLIGQAKTGISSLELSRHLGVKYDTAWLLHNKILRAMTEREEAYQLQGMVQMDDSCLRGELPGGKAGRGSENKNPHRCGRLLERGGSSNSRQDHRRKWLQLRSDLSLGQTPLDARQPGALRWPGLLPRRDHGKLPPKGGCPVASTPTTYRSSVGSTPCSATSRSASMHLPCLQL